MKKKSIESISVGDFNLKLRTLQQTISLLSQTMKLKPEQSYYYEKEALKTEIKKIESLLDKVNLNEQQQKQKQKEKENVKIDFQFLKIIFYDEICEEPQKVIDDIKSIAESKAEKKVGIIKPIQHNLAEMYMNGDKKCNIKPSLSEAKRFYKKASEPVFDGKKEIAGYPKSQFTLSGFYEESGDYKKQYELLISAVNNQHFPKEKKEILAKAYRNLGIMFYIGHFGLKDGLPDNEEAQKYFLLAIKEGESLAYLWLAQNHIVNKKDMLGHLAYFNFFRSIKNTDNKEDCHKKIWALLQTILYFTELYIQSENREKEKLQLILNAVNEKKEMNNEIISKDLNFLSQIISSLIDEKEDHYAIFESLNKINKNPSVNHSFENVLIAITTQLHTLQNFQCCKNRLIELKKIETIKESFEKIALLSNDITVSASSMIRALKIIIKTQINSNDHL